MEKLTNFHYIVHQKLESLQLDIEILQDDVDSDLINGILTITLHNGQQYIINKHTPSQQIWLSSPFSGAHHFYYNQDISSWINTRNKCDLDKFVNSEFIAYVA